MTSKNTVSTFNLKNHQVLIEIEIKGKSVNICAP